jgi:hypothetical protein
LNTAIFYYKNNICPYKKRHVSTLKDHHKAQKIKRKAAIDFEYFIKVFIFLRPIRKIAKSDYKRRLVCPSVCLSVCPSVRMKQLCTGSHGTDFREILYLKSF